MSRKASTMNSHRSAVRLLVVCLLLGGLGQASRSQEVPFLGGRVNDTAEMLSFGTINELEMLLQAHEDATSNQVVVLTIPKLENLTLEEFSMKVVETWKLGQADKDNGVLLLIARDDRKLRIEVGDGLEGALTDAVAGSIIRNEITPKFREGNYDEGVKGGIQAILAAIGGHYQASEENGGAPMDLVGVVVGMMIFTIVVGLFTFIGVASKGFISWFLYVFLMPFWLAFPYGFLGTVIPFFVYLAAFPVLKIFIARNPSAQAAMAAWVRTGPTAGSGWSGRSSGGGFSGGGGSFSGGGSSGSW